MDASDRPQLEVINDGGGEEKYPKSGGGVLIEHYPLPPGPARLFALLVWVVSKS